MSRVAAVLLCLILPACASAAHPRPEPSGQEAMTLCVANRSSSAGTIRVWVDDFRALTVSSGKRECRQIREVHAEMRLFAESMAGGFAGTTKYQGEIRSMGIRCWDWVLRDGSTSEIRLVPCDFSEEAREGS
jgi:hypothetical protein